MKPSIKFSARKHEAQIVIYGDIGFDITAKDFSDQLDALGDVKTITVRIASHGGDYFEGIVMHSRLTSSGAKITVYIDGAASSAASVVAMAGDEIFIAESGEMMIHEARVRARGNAADLARVAARLEAANEQMALIYQRRTGQDIAKVRSMMDAETVFTASQAVELGFATATFGGERIAAKYDPERHPRRYPPSGTLPPRRAEAQRMIAEMEMYLAK
jgi:ATP-dependent protease ClpP protease subunit